MADCYVPYTPSGWRFEKCGDMIGALAPIERFVDTQLRLGVFLERYNNDLTSARAAMAEEVRALLKQGFAGSALLGVRRLYRGVALNGIGDQREHAYEALGRPLLERVVRERLREAVRRSEQERLDIYDRVSLRRSRAKTPPTRHPDGSETRLLAHQLAAVEIGGRSVEVLLLVSLR